MWKNIPLTARAAQRVKFLWVDDAWVTGFLAQHLQIKHQVTYDCFFFKTYILFFDKMKYFFQDCGKYWVLDDGKKMLLYKSLQNLETYVPDFISGWFNI